MKSYPWLSSKTSWMDRNSCMTGKQTIGCTLAAGSFRKAIAIAKISRMKIIGSRGRRIRMKIMWQSTKTP